MGNETRQGKIKSIAEGGGQEGRGLRNSIQSNLKHIVGVLHYADLQGGCRIEAIFFLKVSLLS